MEPAQQPPGIDQLSVPGQRTSPGQAAVVPAQQVEPGQAPMVPAQRTAPEQHLPGPASPAPRRSRQYLRPILAVLSGMLVLLCLGGVGVAYVLYDGATTPDRSAPDAAVDNYLRALLVDRNDVQADLYTCQDTATLDEIHALRAEVEQREREFHVTVRVSWGSLNVSSNDDGHAVRTELIIASFANGQSRSSRSERWQFEVVDQGGWRVCNARRLG